MTSSSSVRPPAPLLAVVGGPTGAGKSTLVNSLVRAPVSPVGVLRPTTRQPVLICNPADTARVHRHGLRPIGAPLLPAGISIIDAPDIDSIEEANRALADELFDDADLWLFVTTATRYADAAAWRHLRAARERQVALAVVLDRVPADSAPEIIDHLRDLLGEPEPPLFVVPESVLDRQGMLPEAVVAPLRAWLAAVVAGPPGAADPLDREEQASIELTLSPAAGDAAGAEVAAGPEPSEGERAEAEPADVPAEHEPADAAASEAEPAQDPVAEAEPVDDPGADAELSGGPEAEAEPDDTPVEAEITGETDTVAPAGDAAPGEAGQEPTGLDAETPVGETVQNKPRPTRQPVGVGRPSEGPPTDPGGQA